MAQLCRKQLHHRQHPGTPSPLAAQTLSAHVSRIPDLGPAAPAGIGSNGRPLSQSGSPRVLLLVSSRDLD